ncbi:hypothetical protein JKF63_02103 [Porcisia hertigi]|uniref:J domain-containing protein n=1 Tax=Porcisia hertigi TaxID=2761500 RepID=A0A836L580_9TRYP|nr:hypothetical protein JKF63_02103 [Porcisia hertigi]
MADLYAILEVDKRATQEDIKRSYRRLALLYHPDKAGPEGSFQFKEVSHAFGVLSDPQKKAIYDTYGEAGLDALGNPVASAALATFGTAAPFIITIGIACLCVVMVLLFLAFLVSFVDGRLHGWNFVKVFSPLFILDFFVILSDLFFFAASFMVSPLSLHVYCVLLASLSAVALTIVIPIAKDRNEASALAGRPDRLQWRVCLIPGYLFSLFTLIAVVVISYPTKDRILKLKSMGLVHLASYAPAGCFLTVLQGCCVLIFFVLVACRADGVITADFSIVVGLPIFILLSLFLVNRFAYAFLGCYISGVSPQATQAGAEGVRGANGGESPAQHPYESDSQGRHPSRSVASNPISGGNTEDQSCDHSNMRKEREERESFAKGRPQSDHQSGETNNGSWRQESAQNGRSRYVGQRSSVCSIVTCLFFFLLAALLVASTAMIVVRLNHKSKFGTYAGVLSLATACIPLFIIIGSVVFAEIIWLVVLCCCGAIMVVESYVSSPDHVDPQNGTTENEAEMQSDLRRERHGQAGEAAPDTLRQDGVTNSRPTPAALPHVPRMSTGQRGATPLEPQPDNQRLSDVD